MALAGYLVRRIPSRLALSVVVQKHYLQRRCSCSDAFGLFDPEGNLVGVMTFGMPPSPPLMVGICGREERGNVIELNRLWVDDGVPRNGESFFISRALKMIRWEIVVSYAEIGAGHIGTIYQATNWIYTGLSDKHTNWTVNGKHAKTIANTYTLDEARLKFGDDFIITDRPRKHRYVYFNAGGARKRELLRKLRYPNLPYPKRVDASSRGHFVATVAPLAELPIFQ